VMLPLGGGQVPVELWYPAVPGSEAGHDKVVFDFITWLPPEAQEDVPSGDKPVPVYTDAYRDLPIDTAHGPYPVSIFVHNIGASRTESAGIMEHWASRGFVVAAIDHPKLTLQDVLAFASLGACTGSGVTEDTTRKRDVSTLLGVLREPSAGFSFLEGAVDAAHVAVSGHSDGARYAADTSGEPGVRLIMLWNNAVSVTKQGDLEAIAYFAGGEDHSSGGEYATVEAKFMTTEPPALFVGTNDVGNLSMTELCNATNSLGRDGMDIAMRYDLCGIDYTLLAAGWDCKNEYLDQAAADAVFNLATTAALEQFLKGKDNQSAWARFRAEHGEIRLSL
jgi:dienelactone hydrolase